MGRSFFVSRSYIRKARMAARRSLIEKKQSRPRRGGLDWYSMHPMCVL